MKRIFGLAIVSALPYAASAQLYTESFDVDNTANWVWNSSIVGDTRNNNQNSEADFFFDYGVVGIPSAPNSVGGTTRGLKMEANVFGTTAPIFQGMSASPLGQHFTGDYVLKFDAWQNFQGPFPGGGSGTTQMTFAGVGARENIAQFPGTAIDGVGFSADGDGGTTLDYRAYVATGAPLAETSGAYAAGNTAGSTNSSHAYYNVYQGTVPAAQTAYAISLGFNNQTGSTAIGALGMAWRQWEIERSGSTVTWKVDGRLIATATRATMVGDNIFVGYFDINNGASTDAVSRQLLFGLVDNVSVVPEPATMTALAVGALALLRRRRK